MEAVEIPGRRVSRSMHRGAVGIPKGKESRSMCRGAIGSAKRREQCSIGRAVVAFLKRKKSLSKEEYVETPEATALRSLSCGAVEMPERGGSGLNSLPVVLAVV